MTSLEKVAIPKDYLIRHGLWEAAKSRYGVTDDCSFLFLMESTWKRSFQRLIQDVRDDVTLGRLPIGALIRLPLPPPRA